ncbi:HTH-type transcriptional regulator CysL [bioreactor metagenome]|jgi:Transcriptional regulator|uniref:HTH-type transcriptional regulator CysL n=1 Tax=bioreactor metagenome TaxID=1076179 RepID=A0A644WEE9_9ZZZZ|nr:LysR family transcriptional regulator [Acidaminococcaceae bacterium]
MDIKELNYIIAIAEEGSISRAAERLYMAQSSLSQFLSKYEKELHTKLFMRTANGVRATYSGDLFVQRAKQMLVNYHRTQNELWDIEELKTGRIELGISSFRGSYLLPHVLCRFSAIYPGIEVVVHEHDSIVLEEKIAAGTLDLALIANPTTKTSGDYDLVMQDEIYIVCTKKHPVMQYVKVGNGGPNRPWVAMKDAAKFKFLLSNRNTILGSFAAEKYKKCGMPAIAVNRNMTAAFAAAMARHGIGLAFTYRSCAMPTPNVEYLSIDKKQAFLDLVLKYPVGDYRSKATKELSNLIHIHMNETPSWQNNF